MRKYFLLFLTLAVFLAAPSGNSQQTAPANQRVKSAKDQSDTIGYRNLKYRFKFTLPASWKGYTIVPFQTCEKATSYPCVPELVIRHPKWTAEHPWQDIPILILTHAQWKAAEDGDLAVSAAPFPPRELGRNRKYVFGLPPRFDYGDAEGKEEVEKILDQSPFHAF